MYTPKDVEFKIRVSDNPEVQAIVKDETNSASERVTSGKGLLGFFLIAMLAGLAGILTPCVFPLIRLLLLFFHRDRKIKGKPF